MEKILSLFVIFALACEPFVVRAAEQQQLAGATSEATASPDFATLEGIPAEALSADEMALVEGKQFGRFFRRLITALIVVGGVVIIVSGGGRSPGPPLPPVQPLPSSGGVPIPPPGGPIIE